MKRRMTLSLLTGFAAMILMPLHGPTVAAAEEDGVAARVQALRAVNVVRAPRHVEEGDRFRVTMRVDAPRQVKRVAIQNLQTNVFGDVEWVTLRSRRAAGESRHTFRLLAQGLNLQKFRAVATYRDAKRPVTSPRFGVHIWRWIDLHLYRPYYTTPGVSLHEYSDFTMNGDRWIGWYGYGDHGMWESRHTPGRDCKAFRGVLGVIDGSQDGSSAQFTIVADETNTVFRSKSLQPGVVQEVFVKLAKPYRLAVQARSTATGVSVYPAVGVPQLLCTDL